MHGYCDRRGTFTRQVPHGAFQLRVCHELRAPALRLDQNTPVLSRAANCDQFCLLYTTSAGIARSNPVHGIPQAAGAGAAAEPLYPGSAAKWASVLLIMCCHLQVSHGAIQFMVYEELRALALRLNPRHQQPAAAPRRHGLLGWRQQVTQTHAFAGSPASSSSAPVAVVCKYANKPVSLLVSSFTNLRLVERPPGLWQQRV